MREIAAALLLFTMVTVTAQANRARGELASSPGPALQPPATTWDAVHEPLTSTTDVGFPVPAYSSQPGSTAIATDPALDTDLTPTLFGSGFVSNNVYRNRAWRAEFGVVPGKLFLTDGRFRDWPERASGFQFSAGYEGDAGFGGRLRSSLFGQTGTVASEHYDFRAALTSIEFYNRLFLQSTEVVVGAGLASQDVSFEIGGNQSQFIGTGATTFAELWHPLFRFQKSDIGIVARSRAAFAPGHWRDTTGFLIPPTQHDATTALELAWGIEFRRRFGKNHDKYWYFLWLIDYQNVTSPWMTRFADTDMTFFGSNLTLGIAL